MYRSGSPSMGHPSLTQTGHYPLLELRDVVFGGDEHTAIAVGPRRHRRLGSLTRGEILLVDAVEQVHRAGHVAPRRHQVSGVEPVALDDGPVGGHRRHAMKDDVV